MDFEINQHDTSNWVLAPEFVPIGFKRNVSVNNYALWHSGISYNADETLQLPSKNKQEMKLNKKDEIFNKILLGARIMVLMRGLPGSGKSTLAIKLKGTTGVILSTDDYFYNTRGKYCYDPSRIGDAHHWNEQRALQKLQDGKTPIIIDNTNLQAWEMKPYVKLALQYDYEVDILDADTPWKLNPDELAKRNSHGVPKRKIYDMRRRYDVDVKIEHIIRDLQEFSAHRHNNCASYGIKSRKGGQNINGLAMIFSTEDKMYKTNIISADDKISLATCNTLSQDDISGEFNLKNVSVVHQDVGHNLTVADSLTSWEYVEITTGECSLNWDSSEKVQANDSESQCSKPRRTRRKKVSGDPVKRLGDTDEKTYTLEDPSISSWNPVESGKPSWDNDISTALSGSESPLKRGAQELICNRSVKSMPQAGAVPRFRRQRHLE